MHSGTSFGGTAKKAGHNRIERLPIELSGRREVCNLLMFRHTFCLEIRRNQTSSPGTTAPIPKRVPPIGPKRGCAQQRCVPSKFRMPLPFISRPNTNKPKTPKKLTGRALLQPFADLAEQVGGRLGRGHDDPGGRGGRGIYGGVRGWTDGRRSAASNRGRGAGGVSHPCLPFRREKMRLAVGAVLGDSLVLPLNVLLYVGKIIPKIGGI